MPDKISKKIIVFLLITSFMLSNFLLFSEKSFAISEPGGGGVFDGGGIGGLISGACNFMGGGFASGLFQFGTSALGLSSSGGGSVPVDDTKNNPKEQCLDKIAWLAAKYMIRKITDDLARWIRGGANGKPRFIQDFKKYLIDTADNAGGLLLEQILGKEDAQLLCRPWRFQIVNDIFDKVKRGKFSFKAQCKVSEIIDNFEDFYEDFTNGGWSAFLTMALDDGSNPIGSYLMTLSEKEKREAFVLKSGELEATINKGMLPGVCLQNFAGGVTSKNYCTKGRILTPGAAIEETIVNVFGTDLKQLELADEFNELIAAAFDAIRMRRLWKDGLVGSDTPDEDGYIWGGWIDDADDWDPGSQGPIIISPENGEIVVSPIRFDWEDVAMEGVTVKNYLIVITDPEGNRIQPDIETPEPAEGEIAVSEYTQTQTQFDNMTLGGIYTWSVAALNESNNIIGGELGGFSLPSTFVIPVSNTRTPTDGQILNRNINFRWTPMRGAGDITHYELTITGPENRTIQSDDVNFLVTAEEFDLWLGGEYRWKVTAYNGTEMIGRPSEESSFKVLKKPILTTPLDDAIISLPYTFDWEDTTLATHYEVVIQKLGGRTFKRESDNESSALVENLGREGNYKWRARADITDEDGAVIASSLWSGFENFTLNLDIPTADARASTNSGAGFNGASDSLTFTEGPTTVYLFGEGNDNSAISEYSWSCDGGTLSSASLIDAILTVSGDVGSDTIYTCSFVVTDDSSNRSSPATVTITIINELPPALLTLSVSATDLITGDMGKIVVTPDGSECLSDCSISYENGTSVVITAIPSEEYRIDSWGGECASAVGETCIVIMDSDKTVTAVFLIDE